MIRFNHKLIAYWSQNREIPNPSDYIIGSARVLPVGPCGYGVPKAAQASQWANNARAVVRSGSAAIDPAIAGRRIGAAIGERHKVHHIDRAPDGMCERRKLTPTAELGHRTADDAELAGYWRDVFSRAGD